MTPDFETFFNGVSWRDHFQGFKIQFPKDTEEGSQLVCRLRVVHGNGILFGHLSTLFRQWSALEKGASVPAIRLYDTLFAPRVK